MKSRYTLTGPCSNCPFRCDKPFYLDNERVDEIADELLAQRDFMCHKTTEFTDDGEVEIVARTRACGGAMATLEREGRSTQMQRITERLGGKVATPDPDAPVYDSIEEWREAMHEVNCG